MLIADTPCNRKDTLLWGPLLGFPFPAAVCVELIVSTCLTSGNVWRGPSATRVPFFFNGHFLSGVTCMTVCDKQKLMGTLLCQFLLNCWHWLQAACLPPSQDLTWNMARGPQLYSPISQLVSDERSRNNVGRTNQEENPLWTALNQGGSICWELMCWFIFLSGKLQNSNLQSTLDIRSIHLPRPSKVYVKTGMSSRQKETTWDSSPRSLFQQAALGNLGANRVSLASS